MNHPEWGIILIGALFLLAGILEVVVNIVEDLRRRK